MTKKSKTDDQGPKETLVTHDKSRFCLFLGYVSERFDCEDCTECDSGKAAK
jgi:hypothetical protein